ncbi:MAG: MBL fold metallo-hydrolase [Rhodospirillaceae bacterium]|jgi:glyoxylase-like metal-dependent hydrolase (beta-lactamase superfamily II)|nr:MBL fold metallo-hydrolase [Rhodospirillaceae bacterium]MBT3884164.1 MBL fold metallo-hydrolase [Rhodospirillaceae bacterium]MBT4115310.1 MBL fold metallo-hydrolase [Rhodospirillaceae bacterium]MBT4674428.1 MBL fold metallo-hydrolase [Rhodospirillaceae bacterium]MBT4722047.1 MBL fold metallo-hydrolase [Rhodospirillaceae bacterium]
MKPKTIGEGTIHSILEMQVPARTAPEMFPDATQEHVDKHRHWLEPVCMQPETGLLIITHQSYLIRFAGLTILVDTCIGSDKTHHARPDFHQQKMPLLDNLRAAGVAPEEIDMVMCTHLHMDHVGWNTRLENGQWVPTFPNARYLFNKTDFEYWETEYTKLDWMGASFAESVLPVMEAGKADLVAGDHEIRKGLWLEPMPGHSPGLVCLYMESGGATAAFCGDAMHHPIQVPEPQLSSIFCDDPVQAVATRTAFVERHADTDTLILPAHFADDSAGHIVSAPGGCIFKFGN